MNSLTTLVLDLTTINQLGDIQLYETVDQETLQKLINSDLLQTTSWSTTAFTFENEKDQLMKLSKKVKNNKLTVKYLETSYKVGRVFPQKGLSLGSLRREIRHTLCYDKYVDVDIENCHPQLLLQLCKANDIFVNYLEQYVNNRKEKLQEVMDYYECSRDDAKLLFIILAYYGSFNNWTGNKLNKKPTTFITNYINELKMIGVMIANSNPNLMDVVKKMEKKNETGTVVSLFLQQKERQILEKIFNYLNTTLQLNNDCVLCFDGIMIPKDKFNNDILNLLTNYILEITGFDLCFTTKPFDQHYLNDLDDNLVETSFEYMSKEFEKYHCKIVMNGIYIKQPVNSSDSFKFFTKSELVNAYEHLSFTNDKGEEESFIKKWTTKNNKIRHYESMCIYPPPLQCPEDVFNLWTPFYCETLTGNYEPHLEGLNFMLNHIKVLCNHEEPVYQYILKWIGQMIQYPAQKTICPTFISDEGAGKGSFLDLLRAMLGKAKIFETVQPERDVWGTFNPKMADCFLVNINELKKKSTLDSMNIIKGLITDDALTIYPKGINPYDTISYHRFLITTNSTDPLPTHAKDRRNLIIRSSDELLGIDKYFTKFRQLLADERVVRTCFDYFKSIPDLKNFKKFKKPTTKYQNELRKMNLSTIEQFLIDLCENSHKLDKLELISKEVYERFNNFCNINNIEYHTTTQKLATSLNLLNIDGITNGKHTNKGNTKVYDIAKLRKHFQLDEDNNDVFVDSESLQPVVSKTKSTKKKLEKQPTNAIEKRFLVDFDEE
jgi:hypothetical protein